MKDVKTKKTLSWSEINCELNLTEYNFVDDSIPKRHMCTRRNGAV